VEIEGRGGGAGIGRHEVQVGLPCLMSWFLLFPAGTNTWDRFEMRIHKRLIDLHSPAGGLKWKGGDKGGAGRGGGRGPPCALPAMTKAVSRKVCVCGPARLQVAWVGDSSEACAMG
jgi:hypothetical protein